MKILLISGSYPPESCGVGDYTYRLSQALISAGLDVECLRNSKWELRNTHGILDAVDDVRADIIHIQYPTVGYGRALGPQLLSCRRPCVVTIHEGSQAHPLRKLSLYGFFGTARCLIFTNSFEQKFAVRLAPWISRKSEVIPIGSNVVASSHAAEAASDTIGYFGLIRHNKGIEQVIELAQLALKRGRKFRILIIGSEFHGQHDYYEQLHRQSLGLPVEWRVGLQGQDLDSALAECKVAYLPFPDGASERRSSLLTMLSRGTPVITTTGPQVPEQLRPAVRFAANPEEAITLAERLMADDSDRKDLRERGAAYASMFSWGRIAQRHIQLYQRFG